MSAMTPALPLGSPVHPESFSWTPRDPCPGIGLCLSGGGYRAMLFHLGALWRLNEAGVLPRLARISSVSGGSLVAGRLGLRWDTLAFDDRGIGVQFDREITVPIRALASQTIDVPAVLSGILLLGTTVGDRVAAAYRKHLFGDATLQALPNQPRFVINATNVQSGVLWRFMKPYMRDYLVGEVKNPTVPLAVAVAASSAFPPVLSPVHLDIDAAAYTSNTGDQLQSEPFTTPVVLTDGGVYDNLGLETAWKRCLTILVSDGGGHMAPEPKPKRDWIRHSIRVLDIIGNQVRSLRKRQIIDAYKAGARTGTYWGIRTHVRDYGLPDPLPCPESRTLELATLATRLQRLEPEIQKRLINWGYAVCDTALRTHMAGLLKDQFGILLERPVNFPYPGSAV